MVDRRLVDIVEEWKVNKLRGGDVALRTEPQSAHSTFQDSGLIEESKRRGGKGPRIYV